MYGERRLGNISNTRNARHGDKFVDRRRNLYVVKEQRADACKHDRHAAVSRIVVKLYRNLNPAHVCIQLQVGQVALCLVSLYLSSLFVRYSHDKVCRIVRHQFAFLVGPC